MALVDRNCAAGQMWRLQQQENNARDYLGSVLALQGMEAWRRRRLDVVRLATGLQLQQRHLVSRCAMELEERDERARVVLMGEELGPRLAMAAANKLYVFQLKRDETAQRPPKDATRLYELYATAVERPRANARDRLRSITQRPAPLSPQTLSVKTAAKSVTAARALSTGLRSPQASPLSPMPAPLRSPGAQSLEPRSPYAHSLRSPNVAPLSPDALEGSSRNFATLDDGGAATPLLLPAASPLDGAAPARFPALAQLVALVQSDPSLFRLGFSTHTAWWCALFDATVIFVEEAEAMLDLYRQCLTAVVEESFVAWRFGLHHGARIVAAHSVVLRDHRRAVAEAYTAGYWALRRVACSRQESLARNVLLGAEPMVFERLLKHFRDDSAIIEIMAEVRASSGGQFLKRRANRPPPRAPSGANTTGDSANDNANEVDRGAATAFRRPRSAAWVPVQQRPLVLEPAEPILPLYSGTFANLFDDNNGNLVKVIQVLDDQSKSKERAAAAVERERATRTAAQNEFVAYAAGRYAASYAPQPNAARFGVYVPPSSLSFLPAGTGPMKPTALPPVWQTIATRTAPPSNHQTVAASGEKVTHVRPGTFSRPSTAGPVNQRRK